MTKLEQLQQELLTLSGRVNTTEEQLQQELLTLSGRVNTTEEQLQQELLTLSGRVNTTEEQLQQELLTLSGRINTTEEQLSPTGIQDILSGGGVSFGATLAGVNPYVNCTTELVRQNTITVPAVPTEPSFGVTETGSADLDEPVSALCYSRDFPHITEQQPFWIALSLPQDFHYD